MTHAVAHVMTRVHPQNYEQVIQLSASAGIMGCGYKHAVELRACDGAMVMR